MLKLNQDNEMKLYDLYRRNLVESLKLYQESAKYYMTVIIAIPGVKTT